MAHLLKNSKKFHTCIQKQSVQNSVIRRQLCGVTNVKCKIPLLVRSKTTETRAQVHAELPVQKESAVNYRVCNLAVGDKLNGFVVQQVEKIPEFSLVAVKLIHEATKAEYFHIDREDSNNAFSVLFRTTPTDSTGLPHILEHTTLCGSIKYPCRDPFFKMLNRSLATFMNAMTAPDWTMYPFLTQNPKDYRNLMSVYLDAVYRPLLKETDFNQEGWRLEHIDPQNKSSPIIIKGVVFNEMKGVFSDNQNLFHEALMNNILPSHTYSVCSGGDPVHIPKLAYKDLVDFHNNYYSPFNAKYYSYGNIPVVEHLKFIDEEYLQNSDLTKKGEVSTVVPPEKRWTEPVRKHITCRPDPLSADETKQSNIAISHLCCSITDIDECFILKIISELLTSGPNSSFYKTLIEPNIGSGFSPVTGFEGETRDTYFTVGLQGVSPEDFPRIIKIFDDTIDNVIKNGFDPEHLESILHSIELNLKHQTSNFGLSLLFNVASTWNHGGDIIDSLKIESKIKKLRKHCAEDPKFLQKKVKKYLKDNKHKLILTMSPDPNYDEKRKEMEEALLREKLKDLNEEMKDKVYADGLKLLSEQQNDDKSCLPTLTIKDLNKDIEPEDYIQRTISNIPILLVPQPTNGITYFRGILNTTNFKEDLSLLPLFALISTKMGTVKHNFKDFHKLITLKTGGLSIGTHFITDTKALDRFEESLTISSYCLNKNLDDMFHLWLELFQEMKLSDVNRFETLVKAEAADLVNGVVRMGHKYAALAAMSLISSAGKVKEQRNGMTYVNLMKNVVQSPPEEVLSKMKRIKDAVTSQTQMRFSSNVLEGTEDVVLEKAGTFIRNISGSPAEKINFQEPNPSNLGHGGIYHVLPLDVNFASKAINAVPYEHEDFPALRVLTRLLTMKFLHPEIREKAGAYGSGLNLSQSGLLTFYSYSDPNPSNSLKVFDRSASWLLEKNFTQEDVDEAKLGIFQAVDAPIPPGDKGMRQFLFGVSDEALRKHRFGLMKVTIDELIEVGVKYLDEKTESLVGRAVIGRENKSIIEDSSHKWKIYSP
ncbi:UNVERIFIED_CONTAM: hypothetical protein PYX00_004977 [Menopon gallinae]